MVKSRLTAYIRLMRLDRPIGIYLVLWPALWGLFLAADGLPQWQNLFIFICGAVLMRSAGCVINDLADRKFDAHVQRTRTRPLVVHALSVREAWILFFVLCSLALLLVAQTNWLTVSFAFGAFASALIYPFMKRYTHLPQVVLGAAFAWSVPMAFAAENAPITAELWLIYTTVVLWAVVYDTFYAMIDREDDLKIGVKSTAILFGEQDRVITAAMQIMIIIALFMIGDKFSLGIIYNSAVVITAGLFGYQQWLIRKRKADACFEAFLNNNWVGMAIFAGIAIDLVY